MAAEQSLIEAAQAGDEAAFTRLVEPHRRELRAHCYRFSGSLHDAEDLLQESLLRAWRGLDGFAGRSSLRTWLFRIATRVCLDALEARSRRMLPMDLGPASTAADAVPAPNTEPIWIEPWPDGDGAGVSPEAPLMRRESVALAFVVALQLLPAKQRAVLLLHDVLGWQASDCADLLDSSVASVNSALQRARQTIDARGPAFAEVSPALPDARTGALLSRYVAAWENTDVAALVALLREDAILAMPPFPSWHRGPAEIGASLAGMVLVPGSAGRFRLRPTRASGQPALATYRRDDETGSYQASSIQLLYLAGDRISAIVAFLDPSLFPLFGLPPVLAP